MGSEVGQMRGSRRMMRANQLQPWRWNLSWQYRKKYYFLINPPLVFNYLILLFPLYIYACLRLISLKVLFLPLSVNKPRIEESLILFYHYIFVHSDDNTLWMCFIKGTAIIFPGKSFHVWFICSLFLCLSKKREMDTLVTVNHFVYTRRFCSCIYVSAHE